ncbi:MAG: transporter [Candidatus Korobacteraceae bacterium]|jgi:hypothetical protein
MRKIAIYTLVAALLCLSSTAMASEGGLFGAPIGGTDINNALLPPPGVYGALVFLGTNGATYEGNNSKPTDYPSSLSAANYGGGVLIVYPWKLGGGHFASQFQLAEQQLWQKLTVVPPPHTLTLKGSGNGLADSYADLLTYSKFIGHAGVKPLTGPGTARIPYGFTLGASMGMEIPLGNYNVNNFSPTNHVANEGHGTWIYIPSIAGTYVVSPFLPGAKATFLDARFFYEVSHQNSADGYKGGRIVDVDFAATEKFKQFQAGIAGAFAQQITDDHNKAGAIVAPDGNRFEKLIMGPVVSYYVPAIRTNFKLKTTFGVHNTNTYLLNTVVLVASFRIHGFSTPPAPAPAAPSSPTTQH